jgi:hypothetical protein
VYGVEICKDGFYVCVVRMKYEENFVDITEMVYDHVLFFLGVRCVKVLFIVTRLLINFQKIKQRS